MRLDDVVVRDAAPADFDRINEIYNWTIVDNHVSFDTEPFDRAARQSWWDARDPELLCLVVEHEDRVVGVAYSSWYRPKAAYRTSRETTIALDVDYWGNGLGSLLLGELVNRLSIQQVHQAIAIVTLPNDASMALHHKLGYEAVGVLHNVGFKNGSHWDTALLEKRIEPASALDNLADEEFAYLTTTGRRSGDPHEIEIWFATDGTSIHLISGGADQSDWVKNLLADPSAALRIGDYTAPCRARFELSESERSLAVAMLVDKYEPESPDAWRGGYLVALDPGSPGST